MPYQINEEACPVPESLLGQLYRSSPHGLSALIDTVPATLRAMLADYCYRRAHLASLAIAIAATCEREDLVAAGSNGEILYNKSRAPEAPAQMSRLEQRRTVTLSDGSMMMKLIAQDLV